jgi:soluble lytic murein transglycosylase-like protein
MKKLIIAITALTAFAVPLASTGQVEAASGSCPQYNSLLAANHMPVATFSRIMFRESRCQPGAVNRRSGARGLLQIMPYVSRHACPGLNTMTARGNVACAARLYRQAGTRPWATTR